MRETDSSSFRRVLCTAAIFSVLAVALVISSAETALAQANPALQASVKETRHSEAVAPGVEHIVLRRGDFSTTAETERWTINMLVLDPQKIKLSLGRALDEGVGTETPSSMASRYDALAAINGGYFRTAGLYKGDPVGIIEVSGRVLSEPERKRPGLAVADVEGGVRAVPVVVDFKAEIAAENGSSHAIHGINCPRGKDELILFTPDFHRTTLTNPDGVEAVVVNGMATVVRDGEGSATIPEGGYVLSASGEAGNWLREHVRAGRTVALKTAAAARPDPGFAPDFVIGGGPLLVRGGKPAAASDRGAYDEGFSLKRHPRTAVGVRADGRLILVTVDGRQPLISVGMAIAELEALMIEFGSVEAINLDGGGSTTMVVRGRVVNSPSDASGERPVNDALLVFLR